MDIPAVQTVVAIADHHSFQSAALTLGVSLSNVSQRVQNLEAELGTRLFDRSSRPPRLTESGIDFVERSRPLLLQWQALGSGLVSGTGQGLLKVGAVHTAVSGGVASALGRLRRAEPNLFIQLNTALTTELVDQLKRQQIDCAVITEPAEPIADMRYVPIAEENLGVIAHRSTVGSSYRQVLSKNSYIRFNRSATLARRIENELQKRNIPVSATMEVTTLDAVEALVGNALGVSIVPVGKNVRALSRVIRTIPFTNPGFVRQLGVITHIESPRSHLVQLLVDSLQHSYRNR